MSYRIDCNETQPIRHVQHCKSHPKGPCMKSTTPPTGDFLRAKRIYPTLNLDPAPCGAKTHKLALGERWECSYNVLSTRRGSLTAVSLYGAAITSNSLHLH